MANATGDPRWDAAASVLIGVLLIVIAIVLAIETRGLLMGETATDTAEAAIAAAVQAHPQVTRVIHLKTQHLGPDELLVGVKVEFARHLTMTELADAINDVEADLRRAEPTAKVVYIEPDIHRSPLP
jgi:divalent metal cation (Fe/Co/Zn/Cd) transporter